jgi:hypothetical protein
MSHCRLSAYKNPYRVSRKNIFQKKSLDFLVETNPAWEYNIKNAKGFNGGGEKCPTV